MVINISTTRQINCQGPWKKNHPNALPYWSGHYPLIKYVWPTSACCQVMKSEICFASCQNFSKLISPLGSLLEQPSFRKYKSLTNRLKNGMMIWKEKKKFIKSCLPWNTFFFPKQHIILSNKPLRSQLRKTSPFLLCCLPLHPQTST